MGLRSVRPWVLRQAAQLSPQAAGLLRGALRALASVPLQAEKSQEALRGSPKVSRQQALQKQAAVSPVLQLAVRQVSMRQEAAVPSFARARSP